MKNGYSFKFNKRVKNKIIAIWKPRGPTSFDIIRRLRFFTGIKKIGHAGTLDPLASGILVVGIGRKATKCLHKIVEAEKEYIATVRFGAKSTTDDKAGEKTMIEVKNRPTLKIVEGVLKKKFSGRFLQQPPNFSAIKVNGRRAYELARKGKKVKLKKRSVEVKEIKIIKYRWPLLKLKITCGAGFYVRSLARDLGKELKVGGYLAELERIRVGQFKKDKAIKMNF